MPDDFLNPYHFVPADKPSPDDLLRKDPGPKAADFRKEGARGRFSHAAYAPGTLSGRIVVKLTTETPLVVGGEQEKSDVDYTRVQPYKFQGETAIPATSLRGMLSSIVEAASQSAMRVFHDKKPVSYRQPMGQALSAIGMLKKENDGTFRLLPLNPPHIEIVHPDDLQRKRKIKNEPAYKHGEDYYYFAGNRHRYQALWMEIFGGRLALKTFIGTYHEQEYKRNKTGVEPEYKSGWPNTVFNPSQERFWETVLVDGAHFDPSTALARQFHYMKVQPGTTLAALAQTHVTDGKIMKKGRTLIIGRRAEDEGKQKRNQIYDRQVSGAVRSTKGNGYQRGLIRILGIQDRDMAETKKHEIFVPYLEEPKADEEARRLAISPQAIETFERLAKEAAGFVSKKLKDTDDQLTRIRIARPYLPLAPSDAMKLERKTMTAEGLWEPSLRDGQLVFFDIEERANGDPVVSAISFSQIWRGLVEKDSAGDAPDAHIASLGDFFGAIDKELLPFSSKRNTISPAEWLFGFVSADGKPSNEQRFIAYASRVRISTGRMATEAERIDEGLFLKAQDTAPSGDQKLEERAKRLDGMVRLKTLGSPKPPSPQLYFYEKGKPNNPIAKEKLQPGEQVPQGRKFYLHQDMAGKSWGTKLALGWTNEGKKVEEDLARLRNAVKPIKEGVSFWFHIDFDNLSEAELGLLCFALQPSANFHHKLGMGKGIGLGTVHLEPQALCLVNRQDRYGTTADVFTRERYSEIILSPNVEPTTWPQDLYKCEVADVSKTAAVKGKTCADHRAAACAAWIKAAYPDALNALLKIGETTKPAHPVHTPLTADQAAEAETDTFRWFAYNAGHIRKRSVPPQQLERLTKDSTELPTLKRNRKP